MKTVEISNIPDILKKIPSDVNLMLLGDTGVGKTDSVRRYCKDNNIYMQTLLLSTILASESLGIPVKTDYNGNVVINTAIPKWVINFEEVHAKGTECLLFLDEFMCATPETQNAFLNFMCKKEVGAYDLSYVRIVLASNIGNYTYKLDKNMLNRICFCNCINSSKNLKVFLKNNTKVAENVLDSLLKYKDETNYENEYIDNEIFQQRNLSSRQIHQIGNINDPDALDFVFEGYTNKKFSEEYNFIFSKSSFFNSKMNKQLYLINTELKGYQQLDNIDDYKLTIAIQTVLNSVTPKVIKYTEGTLNYNGKLPQKFSRLLHTALKEKMGDANIR